MHKRLIQLLALSTSLFATGGVIVYFAPGAAPAPVMQAAGTPVLPTTRLPAVHARVPASQRLPTVVVRPTAGVPAPRNAHDHGPLEGLEFDLAQLGSNGSSGASFDMPYYSFGQSYPRANKD